MDTFHSAFTLKVHPDCCIGSLLFLLLSSVCGVDMPQFNNAALERHPRCLQFGAFKNKSALNIHVQVSM